MKMIGYMCIAAMLALGATANAGVPPTIDNVTQVTAHVTLQDAINTANAGDVIEIGAGTLAEHDITVGMALTIRGMGMDATTIDAQNLGRVMNQSNGLLLLEDMTMTNGEQTATNSGGAIYSSGTDGFEITRVRFVSNHANGGGALYKEHFNSNTTMHFDSCEFISNSADEPTNAGGREGGAVFILDGPDILAMFTNCLFDANFADGRGAAVVCQGTAGSLCRFVNCTFVNHPLTPGGGDRLTLANTGASMEFAGCVFDNNAASRLRINNGAPASVFNCVLGPGTIFDGITSSGDNSTIAPTLVDAPNGDYRLDVGTSGIDMSDLGAYLGAGGGIEDLNGDFRFNDDPSTSNSGSIGSVLDAGCYEHQTLLADTSCEGDANGDAVIDVNDISYVLFRLGNACP
jgi:hypothetical protein